MEPYILAIVVGVVAAVLAWHATHFLRSSADQHRIFGEYVDAFYDDANVLIADARTPHRVVEFLNAVSEGLDNPIIVRRIFWRSIIGRMREEATHPPKEMREFMRELSDMPESLRTHFASGMANALIANAVCAGVIGELFLRMTLPDPKSQGQTATTIAAELEYTGVFAGNRFAHC